MPIHLVLAVLYLRSSLDTEGPAGMRGASRGGKDVGTRAIETRRRSKQRRQEAQPYDEATRTCTDEVRGHQQKRRSETTAVREALRHRTGGQRQQPYGNGPARSACPSPAEKKQPAGPTAKQSNSKLDGCTAAFLDFEQQKNAPWLPQKGPACGSRRRGRGGVLNPVFFIFDPKTYNL